PDSSTKKDEEHEHPLPISPSRLLVLYPSSFSSTSSPRDSSNRKYPDSSSHMVGSLASSCISYTGSNQRRGLGRLLGWPGLRSCFCTESRRECNRCKSTSSLVRVRRWRPHRVACCTYYIENSRG